MDRRVERTKEAEGWLAWPRNTLCLYLPSVTCHVSRVTGPAADAKCANHLDHSQLSGARVGGGRNIQTFKSSFVTFPTSSSF